MLWDASAIRGYSIEASDGAIGTVDDFLFADDSWRIRWLVVDTGGWLSGRKVLLHPSALGQPDPGLRHFPVKLTKQQVKDSPDVFTHQSVSRRMESRMYDYYGWDPTWGGAYFAAGAMASPFATPPYLGDASRAAAGADVLAEDVDPHLRSMAAVTGYHIHATDGEIGHVEDFLIEPDDWSIRYINVDTKNWWPGTRVLISPLSVQKIDWDTRMVSLDVPRLKVKNAPLYHATDTVDGKFDETFLAYYGIGWL